MRDLRVVDGEPVILGRLEARGVLRDLGVDGRAARAADHVLMVVPGPPLVPHRKSGRAVRRAGVDERPEDVLEGSGRDRADRCAYQGEEGNDIGGRGLVDRREHGGPGTGHS